MASPELDRHLAELDRRLDALRPAYEAARAEAHHPARQDEMERSLADLSGLLGTFRAGDGGDKALYLLGQCAQIVERTVRRVAVIHEYEALREQRKKLEESASG